MKKKFDLELFLNEPVSRKNGISLFHQIYEGLRRAILSKRLPSGVKMPSSRLLAKDLKVARNTVMDVYDQLIAEGFLDSKARTGTFVAENLPLELLETKRAENPAKSTISRHIAKRARVFGETSFWFTPIKNAPRAFQMGFSAIDEFPIEIWARISSRKIRTMPRKQLDYGEAQGYPPLREEIAKYLTASRGVRCETSQVIIIAGSQQGLDLIARVLLDEGDEAWIEDPKYNGAKAALLGAGAKLVHVPLDSEGLIVKKGEQLSKKARLAYITPSHQFPLGVVMSLPRRLELLEWANKNSAWIVEDDYDSEFRYEGKPLMTLQGLDNNNRVIYIGTFSKVLFPSLRLGYLVVPPDLVEDFTNALSFILFHAPMLEQLILTDFIREGHFGRHIRRMRNLYAERQKVLINAVKENLEDFLKIEKDVAGMHAVAWLKKGLNDAEIAKKALEQGVYAPPLSFYCTKVKLPDALLLGYTGIAPAEILAGVERLKGMFKSLKV
ncbi:MAG: PLP-dependent aminotransferase family protein [Pyrinomonadaceae bacterium]|nr:PLP-dependent aminotransferase family protein [Pyrinomonadaceae bacterium]